MGNAKTTYGKLSAPKARKFEFAALQKPELFKHLIIVMVLLTLVSIFHVWSRVKVVDMNLQMTEITQEIKKQEEERNRLKLEVASLRTPGRIEALARGELGMSLPTEQQVIIVK